MDNESTPPAVVLDHAVDPLKPYISERVTLYSRLTYRMEVENLSLRVWVPAAWAIEDYRSQVPDLIPHIELEAERQCLLWKLSDSQAAGTTLEFQAMVRINNEVPASASVPCLAELTGPSGSPIAREIAVLDVQARGSYSRYLPELYEQDDMMGRFLMLFESFWKPVNGQIDNIHNYFDPWLTPPAFLPWLATWFGLELETRLPVERQRRLLASAVSLYRRRGTRLALQEYLEIYTGGQVEIVEHRANDLRLGPQTRLGPGIALGTANKPHTFSIRVHLPPEPAAPDAESRKLDHKRQKKAIEAIIQSQKPAHTRYNLVVEHAA